MTRAITIALVAACGSSTPVPTLPSPPPRPPVTDKDVEPVPAPIPMQTALPQQLAFPNEDFRAKQPAAGAVHAFHLPAIKRFTVGDGIDVYLVEQHTLPIVSMDFNVDGGAVSDPEGKEGLADVCAAVAGEGTQKLDKIQLSEALADIAAELTGYATDDVQGVRMSALTKHLDTTFGLFADMVRTPGLRASDFDRVAKRQIEAVKQQRGTPQAIVNRVVPMVVLGSRLADIPTPQSLAAVTLDDCKHELATWTQPQHARLFVVGDITEVQVKDVVAKSALADWKGKAPKAPVPPEPKALAGKIFFVNVPSATQSQVAFVELGPKRSDPDYFANTMLMEVLGGSFTSRINMNLREDKGYAYGARGSFNYPMKKLGLVDVNASVQADSTYQTMLEIDREVKELASSKHAVTKDELEREKLNATLALPSRFATLSSSIAQYRSLVYYGLPLDYYNTYADRIGKVTEAQVKQSAAGHLRPNGVFVVIGDGDAKMIVDDPKQAKDKRRVPYAKDGNQLTLREALTDLAAKGALGPGKLVELDVDGKPVH